jgi:hypothetical protein
MKGQAAGSGSGRNNTAAAAASAPEALTTAMPSSGSLAALVSAFQVARNSADRSTRATIGHSIGTSFLLDAGPSEIEAELGDDEPSASSRSAASRPASAAPTSSGAGAACTDLAASAATTALDALSGTLTSNGKVPLNNGVVLRSQAVTDGGKFEVGDEVTDTGVAGPADSLA